MTGLAGVVGHIKDVPASYRNFNTNDTTSNNILLHYLFLGMFAGMLQNNHHGQPRSVRPNDKWWELDTSLPFVLALKYAMEKK
jgi:fatty-acid desaturase